jgi:mRNA-degrading endonuclease toxin of MazEF toxin-antitoxin module
MVRRDRARFPTPGDIVFFDHETAVDEQKRRRGVVVATYPASATLCVLPGLSEAPAHGMYVRFAWTPAAAYSGLVHDTHFDLLDANDVAAATTERVGKLPPEKLREIAERFEQLGAR